MGGCASAERAAPGGDGGDSGDGGGTPVLLVGGTPVATLDQLRTRLAAAAAPQTAERPLAERGVSTALLAALAPLAAAAGWTTGNVCYELVKPLTAQHKCSLVRLCEAADVTDLAGRPYVGGSC